ncbi:hypothetical protein [Marmoricola sp. URHB0036]|uniref:hypothetical protein n=1 Tax=Marmoricola sp. URHB0036 TaxID=1298863 RepID=UPI0003FDB465|nr:hypothetical protein [Marmoricola sp. URHB0036]
MTRGELTERARTVITVCAVAAVLYAAVTPFVYHNLTYAFVGIDSISGMLLARAIIVGVPNLLALAAVVISGRPFVGVSIAVASAVAMMAAEVLSLTRAGVSLGPDDWMSLIGGAVVAACALLAADLLVWRRPVDTPLLGAVAGLLVGVLSAVISIYQLVLARVVDDVDLFLDGYWLREYAVEGLVLVVAGLLAGAVAQRWSGVRQETAGLA